MAIDATQVYNAVTVAKEAMEDALAAAGSDAEFFLRSGQRFTIKAVLRFRPEQELTDGLGQDARSLTFSDEAWNSKAPPGLIPEKGDQVTVGGRRFAIQQPDPTDMAGQRIYWRCKLRG